MGVSNYSKPNAPAAPKAAAADPLTLVGMEFNDDEQWSDTPLVSHSAPRPPLAAPSYYQHAIPDARGTRGIALSGSKAEADPPLASSQAGNSSRLLRQAGNAEGAPTSKLVASMFQNSGVRVSDSFRSTHSAKSAGQASTAASSVGGRSDEEWRASEDDKTSRHDYPEENTSNDDRAKRSSRSHRHRKDKHHRKSKHRSHGRPRRSSVDSRDSSSSTSEDVDTKHSSRDDERARVRNLEAEAQLLEEQRAVSMEASRLASLRVELDRKAKDLADEVCAVTIVGPAFHCMCMRTFCCYCCLQRADFERRMQHESDQVTNVLVATCRHAKSFCCSDHHTLYVVRAFN